MLKLSRTAQGEDGFFQPPLGGCVLKLETAALAGCSVSPAAFRRLCVETYTTPNLKISTSPAAFRRLCVETYTRIFSEKKPLNQPPLGGCVLKPCFISFLFAATAPAAFRRLCVETLLSGLGSSEKAPAAFRRLCVETRNTLVVGGRKGSSRL